MIGFGPTWAWGLVVGGAQLFRKLYTWLMCYTKLEVSYLDSTLWITLIKYWKILLPYQEVDILFII